MEMMIADEKNLFLSHFTEFMSFHRNVCYRARFHEERLSRSASMKNAHEYRGYHPDRGLFAHELWLLSV